MFANGNITPGRFGSGGGSLEVTEDMDTHNAMDDYMPEKVQIDFAERVTRVESAVENLSAGVEKMSDSIEEIKKSVSGIGKTDFKTIGGGIVGTITIVISVWFIFAAPVTTRMEDMRGDIGRIDRAQELSRSLPTDMIRLESGQVANTSRIGRMESRLSANDARATYFDERLKKIEGLVEHEHEREPVAKSRN